MLNPVLSLWLTTQAQKGLPFQIQEVLLNAPEHFQTVGAYLQAEEIADPQLGRVVAEFCTACRSDRGYDLAGFLSAFAEPALTALITDLQLAGERRGNFEATLAGAVERLKQEQDGGEASGADKSAGQPVESRLGRVREAALNRRQFAGRGLARSAPQGEGRAAPAPGTAAESNG